jgi:predicted ABC-type ATPase
MKVIILSGVSGSGKTTYIEDQIHIEDLRSYGIVSADHYFMRGDGYHFDASKLSEAHAECFRQFIDNLRMGVETVFVDNTNCSNEEIAPYYLGAQAFGYEVEIITLDVRLSIGSAHVENFAKHNLHGVDANAIWQQMCKLSGRKLLPWWTNTTITVRP